MSNGHACCAIGLCCPPGSLAKRATALVAEYEHDGGSNEATAIDDMISAKWLLSHFDIVPLGLGVATIEAYKPHFAKFFGDGGGQ